MDQCESAGTLWGSCCNYRLSSAMRDNGFGSPRLRESLVLSLNYIQASSAAELRCTRLIGSVVLLTASVLLYVLRVVLLALLTTFQPLISFVLSAVAVLGVLISLALEASAVGEIFPFWGMIACSLGCTMLLVAYDGLVRCLAD